MSTTTKTTAAAIAKHYTRLLTLWPKDPLRPNLPFQTAIQHRAALYNVAPTVTTTTANPASSSPSKPTTPPSPALETRHLNALFSLLDNRYATKYPLSPDVLRPKSKPEHYSRLMDEIARAPGKTWWRAKLDEWKMKIRWS